MPLKNIVGDVYGDLTVLSFSYSEGRHTYWLCRCSCGKEVIVRSNNLRTGNTSHCPDKIHRLGNGLVDISGQTFGRLTAICINRDIVWKGERTFWDCLCSCGKIVPVESGNLKSGHTTSCGCYLLSVITTHGCCTKDRRLYGIWLGMIDRCENPKNKGYKSYGAKGICVCDEWHDVSVFFDWAFANGYENPLTIERIQVKKGYNPDNCTWIPREEQNYNTNKSLGVEKVKIIRKMIEWGIKIKDIANQFNCAYGTIMSIKHRQNYPNI